MTDIDLPIESELNKIKAEKEAMKHEAEAHKRKTAEKIKKELFGVGDFSVPLPIPIRHSLWWKIKNFCKRITQTLHGRRKQEEEDGLGNIGRLSDLYQRKLAQYMGEERHGDKN